MFILRKLLRKKPHILTLYNWNSTKTEAHTSSKDFDITFAGYNVIKDLDTGIIFAPFHVGDKTVMVIRDDK